MKSRMIVNKDFVIAEADKKIFGGFVEHMGRCVYNGLYEPDHPAADADGFREDVMELVRELDMPITRYPGGNFVSGYNWKDGIGPKAGRPARAEYAWKALEPNQVGLDEFIDWCKKVNTEILYAVNITTGTPKEAQELVEYCNYPGGAYWSDQRIANGHKEPHRIRRWCLGNEVDGEWQIGHMTAAEYGRVAHETAKMMKMVDRNIELCACGSSASYMPTYGAWDHEIMRHLFKDVDYLSIHMYFENKEKNLPRYLASAEQLDKRIEAAVACCDAVAAERRSAKKVMIALDEWNVWYRGSCKVDENQPLTVGQPLNEEIYDMSDVLVVGGALLSMLDHADRLKIACIAQTVNVISPIMTAAGGSCWRQTIYYPFRETSRYGRGTVMRSVIYSPEYETDGFQTDRAKYLRATAVWRKEAGEITVFAINRSAEMMDFQLELQGFTVGSCVGAVEIHNESLDAVNTENEETVRPCDIAPERYQIADGMLNASLKPYSWNMFRIEVR